MNYEKAQNLVVEWFKFNIINAKKHTLENAQIDRIFAEFLYTHMIVKPHQVRDLLETFSLPFIFEESINDIIKEMRDSR